MTTTPVSPQALAINGGSPVRATFLPYGRQSVDEADIQAVVEVLRSDWLTTGPKVAEFEEAFASRVGTAHAVSFSSGTAALHAAAFAAGLKSGDEAITTPLTFAATANCILYQGASPVFADVSGDTLNLDPEQVEKKISARARAILPVDYAGHPADLTSILEIARRHKLVVIEDACHALGAEYDGRRVGSLADMTVFSFHPVKHITTGEGGMVATNDVQFAETLRRFRNHGISSDARQRQSAGQWHYEMVLLGFNYRLPDIVCALGIQQLKKLDANLARRREIAARYTAAFREIPGVVPPVVRAGTNPAWHLYPIRLDMEKLTVDRGEVFRAMRAENIGVNVHYIPVHLHPYYRERFGYKGGEFPVAEDAYERLISLPMFHGMSDGDAEDVIRAVRKVVTSFGRDSFVASATLKMKTTIIMQARTTSSRLPGKAMLPVGDYPSVALAALRAGNLGVETVVATSDEPSDDNLADALTKYGIRVVRGPLEDVLARFVLAAKDLPEDSLVVRLTGDNVVPDGELVQELVTAFSGAGLEYLSQECPQSGLPYGLGGEAFTVAMLRRAHAAATNQFDREHVTPWIRRNCGVKIHTPRILRGANFSHLRCTIDDEQDYQRIVRLFEGVADPVRAGWFELTQKLAALPGEPRFRVPYRVASEIVQSELTLGTAQLGMEYGIANRAGQPGRALAIRMVHAAIAHGVTAVDTARAYGEAEDVLGEALGGAWRSRVEVITKLDPLDSLSADADESTVRAAVDESVRHSCRALRTETLSTLLLHRSDHYRAWGGAAWRRLLEMRDERMVGVLGASVYDPREALELLRDPAIQHLQIPMNVLDWRWKASGIDRALAERSDVLVHARSSLLQGLLADTAVAPWPESGDFDAASCLRQLQTFVDEFGRESLTDLCFAYVRSQPWVTSVVVGCETVDQVNENLRLFCQPKLSAEQCAELERSLPRAPENLLNPSQWKVVHEPSAK